MSSNQFTSSNQFMTESLFNERMLPVMPDVLLAAMTQDELTRSLRGIVDEPMWCVAVVLVTSDMMIGDLLPHRLPASDVGRKPFAHLPAFWGQDPDDPSGTAVWLEDIELIYSPDGSDPGVPHCRLQAKDVAAVWRLAWSVDSRMSQLTGNLAAAIGRSNRAAAAKAGVRILSMVAASRQVPKSVLLNGIRFSRSNLIYVDYEYLAKLSSASVSLGGFGASVELSVGLVSMAEAVLNSHLVKGVTLPRDVIRRTGSIVLLDGGGSVTMEGEEWQLGVFEASSIDTRTLRGERVPVLLKKRAIHYPDELWPFIRSPLTLIGEEREIPVQIGSEEWVVAITARLIGHHSAT